MPFDFGGGADMYASTVGATEGLKNQLKSTFGWTDAQAYAKIGISGMNGLSDQQELTSTAHLDPDPGLRQDAQPGPVHLLGGQPGPRLRRRRRGLQLQWHRPAGLGVHPDQRGLLTHP